MKKLLLIIFFIFNVTLFQSVLNAGELVFDELRASDFCKDEWTKRGILDNEMYSYCMNKQINGHEESLILRYNYKNIEKVELIDFIVIYAEKKWLGRKEYDFNMVRYEIEIQSEAFLDVKWGLDNGSIPKVLYEKCKEQWISTEEPQWRMVSYCIENN